MSNRSGHSFGNGVGRAPRAKPTKASIRARLDFLEKENAQLHSSILSIQHDAIAGCLSAIIDETHRWWYPPPRRKPEYEP